ncbi:MAG: hypothetical protein OET41_04895 [Xanthomonadales bacterium]|jgi:hypothetical protein|nr:hypothetical protein [Xanthomonadales bacterium]MDH4000804.1 hypothetical protein [Xanthomonadales bacterium]
MSNRNFRFVVVILSVILSCPVFSQEEPEPPLLGPINSDPLTVRGISPRVLDIALFPMSQGLYWEMLMNYQSIDEEGVPRSERFRMIFDPYTDYGRDLYFEFENQPLQSLKRYKRSLEVTMGKDNYVRKKRRLYDPTSFRVREIKEGHEVISFRYDKERVPSSLRWLIFLVGEVHIIDGVLNRIEFTAEKTIERDGVRNRDFKSIVGFGAVDEPGGYVIDWMEEQFSLRYKRKWVQLHTWGRMLKYSHSEFGEIAWRAAPDELFVDKPSATPIAIAHAESLKTPAEREATPPDGQTPLDEDDVLENIVVTSRTRQEITDEFDAAETVRLDLRRKLPFYADEVRKLGFELPKTYGIGVIGLWQNADIDLFDVTVGGISVVEDIPLIDALGSEFSSKITSLQVRGDMWILPFLNLSVVGGHLETDTDVTLRFTPTFQKLYKLKTGEDLPEFVDFPSSTTGSTLGFGLTTGLQYENLIFTASGTYAWALTNETESKLNTLILLGMVGYDFGDIGMQVLTGVQYQKTDRMVVGRLYPEGRPDPVEFGIGIDIEETLFLLGVNKDIGRNWTFNAFYGVNGTRNSFMTSFGYRW